MISLSRFLCWWPSINLDINAFIRECDRCKEKPSTHPSWVPWPVSFKPMQRLHADYCGPFLGRFWALVVEDAFSKFPEVFITSSPTASFTKSALQRLFAREGVAQVLVTDNGTHFSSKELQDWLRTIGCYPLFTAPRHPRSNGQAENFVRSLKVAIRAASPSTYEKLQACVDGFLLQYRNSTHASTKQAPALLFKGRHLRSSMALDTFDVTFFRGNDSRLREGLVLRRLGNRMFSIMDKEDGTVHRRHKDQITPSTPSCEPTSSSWPESLPSEAETDQQQPSEPTPISAPTEPISPPLQQPQPSTTATPPPEPLQLESSPVLRRSSRIRSLPRKLQDYHLTGRSCNS